MFNKSCLSMALVIALTGCATEFDLPTKVEEEKVMADTVFKNAFVYTVDEKGTEAQAVAVKDGVIVYVGDMQGIENYITTGTEVLDLSGKMLLPSFFDAHMHPLSNSYAALFQVALFDLDSADQYLEAIQEFAKTSPKEEWIVGAGFDEIAFAKQGGATKEVLDKILPERAIAIVDRDIHAMLVNSKALEIMGINKNTPDPVGGSIQRDENGEATGLLVDDSAMNLARDFFPQATKEQYKESLLWVQKWFNSQGITSAHDAWVEFDENYYQAFDELAKEGKLTVRYRGSWFVDPNEDYMADIDYGIELSAQLTHPNFQVNSFKFLTDNVLEQDSALLLDGEGGMFGVRNWQQEDMLKAYEKVDKAGMQIHVHTVGDAAVRETVDAIESAQLANKTQDARHSLAHVEVAVPEDIERMGQLGVIAHLTTIGVDKQTDYFEDTDSKYHPVKTLVDAGVNVTIVSDYATSDPDVLANIASAVNRDNSEGATLKSMIEAATINGAYANFLEQEIGTLEVGKKADMVVLSQNLFAIDKKAISDVKIEMTFFEGKRVH